MKKLLPIIALFLAVMVTFAHQSTPKKYVKVKNTSRYKVNQLESRFSNQASDASTKQMRNDTIEFIDDYINNFIYWVANENPRPTLKEIESILREHEAPYVNSGDDGISYVHDYILGVICCLDEEYDIGVEYLESAMLGFEKHPEFCYKKTLVDTYDWLAGAYQQLEYHALSAKYYSKSLRLTLDYWRELNLPSPFSIPNAFEDIPAEKDWSRLMMYLTALVNLELTDELQSTIKMTSSAFDDWTKTDSSSAKYVKAEVDYFIARVVNGVEETSFEDIVEKMKISSDLMSQNTDFTSESLWQGRNNFALSADQRHVTIDRVIENLLEDKQLEVSSICDSMNYFDLIELFYKLQRFQNNISAMSKLRRICECWISQHRGAEYLSLANWDRLVCNEREKYFSEFESSIPVYRQMAIACNAMGDFGNAIKYAKFAYDITNLDDHTRYENRKSLINLHGEIFSGYYTTKLVEYYLFNEIESNDVYATCLFSNKDYFKSYKIFTKRFDITKETSYRYLDHGCSKFKLKNWDSRSRRDYWNLLSHFCSDRFSENDYQPFNDIVFDSNTIFKSYWQDYISILNEKIVDWEKFKDKHCLMKALERNLEKCYYDSRDSDRLSLLSQIEECDYMINQSNLPLQAIDDAYSVYLHSTSSLPDNDIIVDFFPLPVDNGIIVYNGGVPTTGPMASSYLYANIFRGGWRYPVLCEIGQMKDSLTSTGILSCAVYPNMRFDIHMSELYQSEEFSRFIWEKIIEAADIKDGENIYFVPSATIDHISIENLAWGDSTIGDRFNIHRISSLRQLGKEHRKYKPTDKCVAFGDIQDYGGKLPGAEAANTMGGEALSILDRSVVRPLPQTGKLISTISECVPNTEAKLDSVATKEEFMKLDNNSPNMLVLATHGFNFSNVQLGEAEEKALFGVRDYELSDMEKGLLTSGLYLASPKGENVLPIDGLLTARDLTFMDLSNVDVAVLVGCSSAVGLTGEDGTYGLVRALKIAGVKTVIGALWDVDVEATQMLFEKFFGYYTSGSDCREAMKKAQHDVKNYRGYDESGQLVSYKSPYYWAGFIVID